MISILIMRAFVKLREVFATHKELAAAVVDVHRRQERQGEQIPATMETVTQIFAPSPQWLLQFPSLVE